MSDPFLNSLETAESVSEKVNILVYGPPAVGKTFFAGSGANDGENVLILSIENGLNAISRPGNKTKIKRIDSYPKLLKTVQWVQNNPYVFDWVIVDSLSRVQSKLIWPWIAENRKANRDKLNRELQEYNTAFLHTEKLIDDLCYSKANVIFLATDTSLKEDSRIICPDIDGRKGKMPDYLMGRMDLAFYVSIAQNNQGEIIRKFDSTPHEFIRTQDKLGLYPKPVANLTLERLTNDMQAKYGVD